MSATIEGARILVVDDVPDQVETMRVLLGLWGYEVQVATNGTAALDAIPEFEPDVALLDRTMPGMDGDDLARLLRGKMGEECPLLVAVTGWADPRHAPDAQLFDAYLVKPVDPQLLHQVIYDLLERRNPSE